jgi:hypothetical protein
MRGYDLTVFKASMTDVFLGGSGNLVLEKNGKVDDKGKMNMVLK